MKKVIILGASGVIGQHMRLCVPETVIPVWVRSKEDRMHVGIDLNTDDWVPFLLKEQPNVVVNLAGEGNVDEVGNNPDKYHNINVVLPGKLAEFCQRANIHYVHVSSQAVFNGENPPYHEESAMSAVNAYGRQKIEAEQRVRRVGSCWTIVRPSFVMGIKPIKHLGRPNPAEQMLSSASAKQVANRWFTACDATVVAKELWRVATDFPIMRAIHVAGTPRVSRFDLATALGSERTPARHEDFKDSSPRARDTTFMNEPHRDALNLMEGMYALYHDRNLIGPLTRAREISLFTGISEFWCREKLRKGFMPLHHEVADDFRKFNPTTMDSILEWYRRTFAYIWELSAYHLDAGFNYVGMCRGIIDTLIAAKAQNVLNLGDGIGDMTLDMRRAGLNAIYHDLYESKTADFAQFRFWMHLGSSGTSVLTNGWNPPTGAPILFDAICAADFMEHLPNVEEWAKWIFDALKPGGLLFTQNAFNCGSGPDGSIPMHLTCNDRFEKDWDPLMESLGFSKLSTNWYKKPEVEPYASSVAV